MPIGRDGSGPHGAVDSFGPRCRHGSRGLASPRRSRADRRSKRGLPRSRRTAPHRSRSRRSAADPSASSTAEGDHARRIVPVDRIRVAEDAPRLSGPARFMMRLAGRRRAAARAVRCHATSIFEHVSGTKSPSMSRGWRIDLLELCRRAGVTEIDPHRGARFHRRARGLGNHPADDHPAARARRVLTAEQLRWVLLHELAPCPAPRFDRPRRSSDSPPILHFFNPAIWIANRIIHQLREYACDDLAVALEPRRPAVESGEAFVRILRHADRGPPRPGRGPRHLRPGFAGRLLPPRSAGCWIPSGRSAPRPGTWSLWGLILLAVVSVPHLRAAGERDSRPIPKPPPPEGEAGRGQAQGIRAARRGAGRETDPRGDRRAEARPRC